jgi:uncharacterized Zn-binding protein involved in type VI secretion
MGGFPAARLTDQTAHGGIVMVGCPTVMMDFLPASRIGDMHVCPMVTVLVPHVGGPFVLGSFTVLVGGMPQSRVTDMLICVGPPDVLVMGSPTVMVGMVGGGGGAGAVMGGMVAGLKTVASPFPKAVTLPDGTTATQYSPKILLTGSAADRARLSTMLDQIAASGPKGKAFIDRLGAGPNQTRVQIATSVTKKDGTVISMARTGGGITLRPTESQSGDTEVTVDPNNLIDYKATDGTTAKETPNGLLLHEMGHADLLNSGDPAQTTGGAAAESNVRTDTNPVRQELGLKPDAG